MSNVDDELVAIHRRESGRCIATLVRLLGDIDAAEDAVAEAFTVAAEKWRRDGIPPNPGGWIMTTAKNRAIDRHRRDTMRPERHRDAATLQKGEVTVTPDLGTLAELDEGERADLDMAANDQLRLLFLCCHPALAPDSRVALTLRLLCGLRTPEIARAFLVPESTMSQRIVRAKKKIRDNHITHALPDTSFRPARLQSVLASLYLMFNEGHTASSGDDLIKPELTGEAITLARLLHRVLPDEPEVTGLLALLLLSESRRAARTAADGSLVPLAEQDRSRWDRELIIEGHALVRECLRRNDPGPYQLQAAIAAVHADADTAERVDWHQIVALYDHLHALQPNDIVGLNRAIAIRMSRGVRAALEALTTLHLDDYHLFHATRAEFLAESGDVGQAIEAIDKAIGLTTNRAERRHLDQKRAQLHERTR